MYLPNLSSLVFGSTVLGIAMGGAALPQWASAQNIEHSGNTYHVQVCPTHGAPDSARCHAHVVTDRKGVPFENLNRHGQALAPDAAPDASGASPAAIPAGYGPADLRSAYGLLAANTGQPYTTIAIVDAYGYTNALNDLNVYRRQFGMAALPACSASLATGCFAKYNQYGRQGSYPLDNTGWAQETALDLEMASAMCPACKLVLVQANSNSYADLATAENTAASLGAHAISNSYGGTESSSSVYYEAAYAHPGVAVYAPSGSGYATWMVFGGTSVAAPLIAGIFGANGAPYSYAARSLYAYAASNTTQPLHDVSSGSNGSCGGSYLCTGMPGYDGPSGLGTPNGLAAFQ